MANELHAQANRVRDLIGNAHWYSDGHQKEYLLIELLRRHLPAGMIAARGFVIGTSGDAVSTEQDILVIDATQEGPVFNQGGVVITFPRAVRAAISVKTRLDSESVRDSTAGLSTVRKVTADQLDPRALWCGAYYFDADPAVERNPRLVFDQIRRAVAASPVREPAAPQAHPAPRGPDLHCTAFDLAFKLEHGYASDPETVVPPRLLGYRCRGVATAVFLGEVLDHVATARGSGDTEFRNFAEGNPLEPLGEEPLAR